MPTFPAFAQRQSVKTTKQIINGWGWRGPRPKTRDSA